MALKDFLENILERQFSLDCTSIKLHKHGAEKDIIHVGMGLIYQQEDGAIGFKIYCNGKPDLVDFVNRFNGYVPGKIIPTDKLCDLVAIDQSGAVIKAYGINPNVNYSLENYIVTGRCSKIFRSAEFPDGHSTMSVSLYYKGEYDIPPNVVRETNQIIDGETRGRQVKRSGIQFMVDDYEFEILIEPGCTVLVVSTEKEVLPYVLAKRAEESLQFVTSNNSRMIMSKVVHGSNSETIIYRQGLDASSAIKFFPPIDLKSAVGDVDFENLFRAYFKYINTFLKEETHPIAVNVDNVIEASKASWEAYALTLGVSVEGILKTGYNKIYSVPEDIKKDIKCVKDIIETSGIDSNLVTRIQSAIGNMQSPSAKDRLHALKENGVLTEELICAWGKMRNTMAHNLKLDLASNESTQIFLDNIYKTITLYYLLIFNMIKYVGKYIDYSAPGFPIKNIGPDKK